MLRLPAVRALKSSAVSSSSLTSTPSPCAAAARAQCIRGARQTLPSSIIPRATFTTTRSVRDAHGNIVGGMPNVPDTPAEPILRNSTHAISNPTLANIEKRWPEMPPQEQAELWMALRDRMTNDWHTLTMQEKKTAYWIAFGPHGPRAQDPPDKNWQIFKWTSIYILASCAVFVVIRYFARTPPKTMTKEWQEMTNEYLKAQRSEAITGVSSPGYKGKGMVQSEPGLKKYQKDDDE
ncbi:MAG: Cytochrome c oxidase subunit 5A [Chrysothrix sp. TS-e1954]|nr:MAG: Cytochrome c oxidase subunit 5A [Chrysothrix sp. TS-e1954]